MCRTFYIFIYLFKYVLNRMLIILCCYFYVLCLKGFVPSPDVFQNQFAPLLAQVPALTLLYVWKCYKERLRERNHGCCSLLSSYNLDLNTSVYLFIYLSTSASGNKLTTGRKIPWISIYLQTQLGKTSKCNADGQKITTHIHDRRTCFRKWRASHH